MQKERNLVVKEDNVIDFKTEVANRKLLNPNGPTGPENWLKELKPMTIFVARRKGDRDLVLNKYLVIEHKTVSSNLIWATPDERQLNIWTPSLEFSRAFDYIETLGEMQVTYKEEQSEKTDG